MAASAFGGLRWSLTEVLLRKESMGLTNPFASIFFLAPLQAIILLVISAGVEGFITIFKSAFFISVGEGLHTVSFCNQFKCSKLNSIYSRLVSFLLVVVWHSS
jgi:solute carrier family 35 protein C2